VLAAAAGAVAVGVLAIAVGPLVIADRRSATIWAVTLLVAIALVAGAALAPTARRDRLLAWATAALLLLGGVELALMSLPSMPQGLREGTAFTDHATATTRWLTEQQAGSTIALTDDGAPVDYQMPGLRPNANVVAGVPSPDGYDGGVQITERWAEALRRFTPEPPVELPLRNSLQLPIDPDAMARLGVRFVLLDLARPADLFVPGWIGPRVADDRFAVYENPAWIGDAIAWPRTRVVQGSAADMLRDDPDSTRRLALVEDPAAELFCDGDGCDPVGLEVDRRTAEHLVVEATLAQPAVVSVARQALDGWSVTVDGDPAEVVVVDGLFLGVAVPEGTHTIEWRYHQPWFVPTIVISLLAVAATIALAVVGTVSRRADSSRDDVDPSIEVSAT
jgi:hypothetical protein